MEAPKHNSAKSALGGAKHAYHRMNAYHVTWVFYKGHNVWIHVQIQPTMQT